MLQAQRNIGILSSILRNTLYANHIHSQLLCTLADECLNRNGRVVEVALSQEVHIVARLGVEQVVHKHRIELLTTHRNAQLRKHHKVILYVLTNLSNRLILKQRS